MALYKRLLLNEFKRNIAFRANFLIGLLINFFYIFMQVFIWKGLYGGVDRSHMGISLEEMIAYVIFASTTRMLTRSGVMTQINDSVQDGSIAQHLLLPVGFRSYYFLSNLSGNLFFSIYNSLPPILAAVLVFGLDFEFSVGNLGYYFLSVSLAFIINFLYSFIMGMSVVWFKNSFFLENLDDLVFKLFSGAIVPLWFFPVWLSKVSYYLPFRYVVFEPISILLGKTPADRIPVVLATQAVWALGLYLLMSLIWGSGRKHIMVQGG